MGILRKSTRKTFNDRGTHMILTGKQIRERCSGLNPMIAPFSERTKFEGCSYGLSFGGYDIRIKQGLVLRPNEFRLASTVEHFIIPNDLMAFVKDKSTWARRGLSVFNTVYEASWRGHATLELKNQGDDILAIPAGVGIAQLIFQELSHPLENGYQGKYSNQPDRPVEAILESSDAYEQA